MAKRKGTYKRKKLIPVIVDKTTRWGTTKAKQASADSGRAIKNVLAEIGIEPTLIANIANAFEQGRSIEKRVELLEVGHRSDIQTLHDRLVQITAILDHVTTQPPRPPLATGTNPHGVSLQYLCSCGLTCSSIEQYVAHYHAARAK